MTTSTDQFQFQAEVQQLLDIVINSLYSNKDIFLRELISNASDALDKRRFQGLTDDTVATEDELEIRIERDPALRTLSVSDNGIGMSRDDLVTNLGTIAKSGTAEFLAAVERTKGPAAPDLIGQFGVGFYASFMVADRVTVVARKAGEASATKWESSGQGSYTLNDAERDGAGTTVTLHLKNIDSENGIKDYTDQWVVAEIVRRYSDFVSYPIRMEMEQRRTEDDKPVVATEVDTLNSMQAIWTRATGEVPDEEYDEFYKHITHDWASPLARISTRLEGAVDARALIYIPSHAPPDLYYREMSYRGLQLYVRRVFILDECRDLMPPYLRFIRGVVDAENLSLNVSRELLQQDRQIAAIRKFLVRKILEELKRLKTQEREKYATFWTQFGPVIKEGLLGFDERREAILDLVLTPSSAGDDQTSLAEYVTRMRPNQEQIFYLTAPTREAAAKSPHAEVYLAKGYEVLFFTDPVDEVWLQQAPEFDGKVWRSVDRGAVELPADARDEKEEKQLEEQRTESAGLVDALRTHLKDRVKDIQLTNRLTTSAACLVGDTQDLPPGMAEMLRRMGQEVPEVKRILELNPSHPIMEKLRKHYETDADDPVIATSATLLYDQALLAEGGQVDDPAALSAAIADLMLKTL